VEHFSDGLLGRRPTKQIPGTTGATHVLYDKSNVVQEIASDGSTTTLLTGLGVDETLTRSDEHPSS